MWGDCFLFSGQALKAPLIVSLYKREAEGDWRRTKRQHDPWSMIYAASFDYRGRAHEPRNSVALEVGKGKDSPLEPLEGVRPCQRQPRETDFGLLASRAVGEQRRIISSQQVCGHLFQQWWETNAVPFTLPLCPRAPPPRLPLKLG